MADCLLVSVPVEQMHRALSILEQVGVLSPDGPEVTNGQLQM